MQLYKYEKEYKLAEKEYCEDKNATLSYLARKYGFDPQCFSRYLKQKGITIKNRRSKEKADLYDKAIEEYKNNNVSALHIAQKYHLNEKNFNQHLKRLGIMRTTWNYEHYDVDESYFEEINTPDKAYWLGMLFADGSVKRVGDRSSSITLELSNVDLNHLEKFKQALCYTGKIHHRKNRNISSVRITRNKMERDLEAKGCIPNKTENGWIDIDALNGYESDFLRGFIDGDGYIEKSYKKCRVIITVKAEKIKNALMSMLEKYRPNCRREKNFYRVNIENQKGFYQLLHDLYSNASTYLTRKYCTAIARLDARPSQLSLEGSGQKSAE